jgi:choline dehydrogenase-like flavoprotein
VLVRENAGPAPFQIAAESGKWGRELREEIQSLFGTFMMLGAFVEQLPYDDNCVRLSGTRTHAGMPAARVDFQLVHSYEREGYRFLKGVIVDILEAAGATEICHVTPELNSGHYMGGHRMGTGRDASIVDSYLESHEVPGLFLATAGAFPTGGVSNPTLTTVALCLRMADRMLGRAH